MKKEIVLLMLLLAVMPMQLIAQVNPQKGYVVTNDNDDDGRLGLRQ